MKYYYRDILLRPPDPGGWDAWTSYLAQCVFDYNCSISRRSNVSLGFFWSPEFINKMNQLDPTTGMPVDSTMANPPGSAGFNEAEYNRRFVYWCYVVFLKRDPHFDQASWDAWTNALNSSGDYAEVVHGFIYSPEYRNRTFD
jgi:Domain of unknown function (DUF4214)